MTDLTPEQAALVRRLAEREKQNLLCRADDVAALLDLLAQLGGEKDRAEWERDHEYEHAYGDDEGVCDACAEAEEWDPRHTWDSARWSAEWRARHMGGT